MQRFLIVLAIAFGLITSANAQISFGIGIRASGLSINLSSYPNLVRVPDYPVYYDPQADSNYFFYDGLYWVYEGDNWYASDWYNGPWYLVDAYDVPLFVLRVPVRYYHRPPAYFRGWSADAPPRWDEHWGRDWNTRRSGWDQWDRRSAPRPAPLPTYQRQYSGDRYPHAPEQQQSIRSDQYRYQPHEPITQQYWQRQGNAGPSRAEPQQRPPAQQQQQAQRPAAQQPQQTWRPAPKQPEQAQRPAAQQQQQRQRPPAQQQQQAQRPAPQQPQQRQRPPAQQQQQAQRPRAEPQGKGRESTAPPREKGRQKDAGPGDKGHDNN